MTIDERLEALVERHEALAQSVDLLVLSSRDLRAVAEAALRRQQEQRERDAQYLRAIGEVFKHWANGEEERNG
jgi:hypothetical protein